MVDLYSVLEILGLNLDPEHICVCLSDSQVRDSSPTVPPWIIRRSEHSADQTLSLVYHLVVNEIRLPVFYHEAARDH